MGLCMSKVGWRNPEPTVEERMRYKFSYAKAAQQAASDTGAALGASDALASFRSHPHHHGVTTKYAFGAENGMMGSSGSHMKVLEMESGTKMFKVVLKDEGRTLALCDPDGKATLAVAVLADDGASLVVFVGGAARCTVSGVSCSRAPTDKFAWTPSWSRDQHYFTSINLRMVRKEAPGGGGLPDWEIQSEQEEKGDPGREQAVGHVTLLSPVTSVLAPKARELFGKNVHICGPIVPTGNKTSGVQGMLTIKHDPPVLHYPTVAEPGGGESVAVPEGAGAAELANARDAHLICVLLGLCAYNTVTPWSVRMNGAMMHIGAS